MTRLFQIYTAWPRRPARHHLLHWPPFSIHSIDAARHPCFRHDSHIACHELLRLPTAKVITELAADLSRIKGRLHEEVLTEVIAAVKRAPTLSPTEQTRIADALSGQAAGGN